MRPDLFLVGILCGALCGALGVGLGAWAALWWRDRVPFGQRQLVRRLFVHVDDLVGATKTENELRAGKRFRVMRPIWRGGLGHNLGRTWADAWWPVRQYGGTTARPTTRRMGVYVRLEFSRPWSWRRPFRIWEIAAVTVWWTSEAAALAGEFARNVGRKVAQALRLGSVDGLDWSVDWSAGCIRYDRTRPAVVPDRLDSDEEMNHA